MCNFHVINVVKTVIAEYDLQEKKSKREKSKNGAYGQDRIQNCCTFSNVMRQNGFSIIIIIINLIQLDALATIFFHIVIFHRRKTPAEKENSLFEINYFTLTADM